MNQFYKHLVVLLYTYGPKEALNDTFCSDLFIVPRFLFVLLVTLKIYLFFTKIVTAVFAHVFDLRHFKNLDRPQCIALLIARSNMASPLVKSSIACPYFFDPL